MSQTTTTPGECRCMRYALAGWVPFCDECGDMGEVDGCESCADGTRPNHRCEGRRA